MTRSNHDADPSETFRLTAEELRNAEAAPAPAGFSVVIYTRDGVRAVPIPEGDTIVLGRSSPADVTVRDDSLSRQHAVLEVQDGVLFVEDLGSTNGTWVRNEQCERSSLCAGDEVRFGAVRAVVAEGASSSASCSVQGHEVFRRDLSVEIARARSNGRGFALVVLRDPRRRDARPGRWVPRARQALRPFDSMAMYSMDTAEILMPEVEEAAVRKVAATLLEGSEDLLCGIALFPRHGSGAEELLDLAIGASRNATTEEPMRFAPDPTGGPTGPDELRTHGAPIARAPATKRLFEQVDRLASSSIPVLITGETGVGKEVVARTIHQRSRRSRKPWVCVNCASIAEQLVESLLFGHERGAFTGAVERTRGVFEAAAGGTVFLDEIGELTPPIQAALLRVLEARTITRVGSTRSIDVDVRVIAATHRDLSQLVSEGKFREDLYYRLDVMTLRVPALRERVDDIAPLALRFLHEANDQNQCALEGIDASALELLKKYRWPGNVRELRNAIQRGTVIASGTTLSVEDLPSSVRELASPRPGPDDPTDQGTPETNLRAEVARFESDLILRALERCRWDRKNAARVLGIPLRTLAYKMQAHGIRKLTDD